MNTRRLAININSSLAYRITAAAQFSMKHSVYPSPVSVAEMTSAQALMITLFHSFLFRDNDAIRCLLSFSELLPQLRSSFIGVWLRDDFNFRRKDVAKVLSTVAHFIQTYGPIIPDSILFAICGLEEKYDIFSFFQQNGDEVSQQLLAYLNPLITRGTQVEPHLLQESKEKWNAKTYTTNLQKNIKKTLDTSLQTDKLDLVKCPPTRPPRRNRLSRSDTLPASSKFRTTSLQLRLEVAIEAADPASVEQALIAGARPNQVIKSPYGTPLHLAASKGLDTIIRVLLRYGANVNACNQSGWRPLHVATHCGHLSCVQILLEAGANPRTDKITPLQIAMTKNYEEIAELIRSSHRYHSTEV